MTTALTPRLISRILDGYALSPYGVHGLAHWARVLENGRRLAALTPSVDTSVVELFAVFHDSRRLNDMRDDGHGGRGADLARQLRGDYFDLDEQQFAILQYACLDHTSGHCHADATVQVCWDSDRLDLLRVGTRPRPELLCTDAARTPEILTWANHRASAREVPDWLSADWGLAAGR